MSPSRGDHAPAWQALLLATLAALSPACSGDDGSGPATPADAGLADTGLADTGQTDAGLADTGPADAAPASDQGSPEPADLAAADLGTADLGATPDLAWDDPYPAPRGALLPLDGQLLLGVDVAGHGRQYMVVDTGAIRSALHEGLLRDVRNGVGRADLSFGPGLDLPDYEVIAADLAKAEDYIGVPLGGLIGLDLFQRFFFALDYRQRRVHVAGAMPASAPPEHRDGTLPLRLPVELVQGMPVVEVELGGRTLRLIADTGSGVTLIKESLLPAAALEQAVSGYTWYTSYGSDPGRLLRLPGLRVAGAAVEDTWVVAVPDEHHLARVFEAIGVSVDGFLGFPVYRRFFLEIPPGLNEYLLYPDPAGDPVAATEWDRVGVELSRSEGKVLVDMVFRPSDAERQGLLPGDELRAVDGATAADLPLDELRLRLRGEPGSLRHLRLQRAETALERDVAVDRLLPPAQP